ncbi:MAG: hypothetical protein JWN93_93 [Hyphomicrobiales bacterium]|nr:hypothetical protein [Hyphomicrobiales bacterium]
MCFSMMAAKMSVQTPSLRAARALFLAMCGVVAAGVLVPGAALAQSAAPSSAQSPAGSEIELLTIATASGAHEFKVEVMRTDEQRARGLMHRRYMPADRGMLFDFKSEQPVMMWMRNTYIPLDMVFIRRDGTVINVAENTEPLSDRTIASAAPAFSVLEVNAGVARKIGLKPGDRVRHPLFGR